MRITKTQLKQIIEEELNMVREATDEAGLQEGMENLTPENLQMVLRALGQLALPAGLVAAASVALTNAVHGKPDAEQEKADLYDRAAEAGRNRRQNNP